MWAVIKNGKVMTVCDAEPSMDDLASRDEIAVEGEAECGWTYDGVFHPPVGPVPTLDELKAAKLQQIDSWTANAITGGFVSTCTGANVRFDSDKDTQITMQGIALNAMSARFATEYPDGCPCRGYAESSNTKTIFMLTGEQVLAFCADMSIHIGTCKQIGWQLQAAVAAATTAEELDLVVWPE